MSIRSMTGYGRGSVSKSGLHVTVEISSVNHKQLDLRIDLPRSLAGVEALLKERLRSRLARGSVSCRITVEVSESVRCQGVGIDVALAKACVERLRKTAQSLKLPDDLSAASLLAIPGVVRVDTPADHTDIMLPLVEQAVDVALKALIGMREKEGKALAADIRKRQAGLRSDIEVIARHAPEVVRRYRHTLMKRIHEAGIHTHVDDEKLVREVAFFADRSDITEEITRFHSHLKQTLERMASDEPVGRALDFLMQELFREINTIGSKANDAEIAARVVHVKAELERIREQIQNVE